MLKNITKCLLLLQLIIVFIPRPTDNLVLPSSVSAYLNSMYSIPLNNIVQNVYLIFAVISVGFLIIGSICIFINRLSIGKWLILISIIIAEAGTFLSKPEIEYGVSLFLKEISTMLQGVVLVFLFLPDILFFFKIKTIPYENKKDLLAIKRYFSTIINIYVLTYRSYKSFFGRGVLLVTLTTFAYCISQYFFMNNHMYGLHHLGLIDNAALLLYVFIFTLFCLQTKENLNAQEDNNTSSFFKGVKKSLKVLLAELIYILGMLLFSGLTTLILWLANDILHIEHFSWAFMAIFILSFLITFQYFFIFKFEVLFEQKSIASCFLSALKIGYGNWWHYFITIFSSGITFLLAHPFIKLSVYTGNHVEMVLNFIFSFCIIFFLMPFYARLLIFEYEFLKNK